MEPYVTRAELIKEYLGTRTDVSDAVNNGSDDESSNKEANITSCNIDHRDPFQYTFNSIKTLLSYERIREARLTTIAFFILKMYEISSHRDENEIDFTDWILFFLVISSIKLIIHNEKSSKRILASCGLFYLDTSQFMMKGTLHEQSMSYIRFQSHGCVDWSIILLQVFHEFFCMCVASNLIVKNFEKILSGIGTIFFIGTVLCAYFMWRTGYMTFVDVCDMIEKVAFDFRHNQSSIFDDIDDKKGIEGPGLLVILGCSIYLTI
eukprot:Awhi_evm1s7020